MVFPRKRISSRRGNGAAAAWYGAIELSPTREGCELGMFRSLVPLQVAFGCETADMVYTAGVWTLVWPVMHVHMFSGSRYQ
jgi:hypothetical protein